MGIDFRELLVVVGVVALPCIGAWAAVVHLSHPPPDLPTQWVQVAPRLWRVETPYGEVCLSVGTRPNDDFECHPAPPPVSWRLPRDLQCR
jgi:hypothetical protein